MKKQIVFSLLMVLFAGQTMFVKAEQQQSGVSKVSKKIGRTKALRNIVSPMRPEMRDAVINGDLEKVKQLIRDGAHVNAQDEDGNTALILAAMYGQYQVARELANQKGININAQNHAGKTALDWASSTDVPPADSGVNGDDLINLAQKRSPINFLLRRKDAKRGSELPAGAAASSGN